MAKRRRRKSRPKRRRKHTASQLKRVRAMRAALKTLSKQLRHIK